MKHFIKARSGARGIHKLSLQQQQKEKKKTERKRKKKLKKIGSSVPRYFE